MKSSNYFEDIHTMEKYVINATKATPEVIMDFDNGLISIKGRSLAENSVAFFSESFLKLEEYFVNPKKLTNIEFKFEYFNSTSFKLIIDLLILSKKLATGENKLNVKWFYESDDEDILMLGKETERLVEIPFEFIPY